MTTAIIDPRLNVKKSVDATGGRAPAAAIRTHGVRDRMAAPRQRTPVIATKIPSAFQYPIGW
jgi:hypothetical protein